jgi:ABC-type methionine transport system permease subunit
VDGDRHPEWVRVYVSWINFFLPSRLFRRSTNGTPAALSLQTISRSSATEASEVYTVLGFFVNALAHTTFVIHLPYWAAASAQS